MRRLTLDFCHDVEEVRSIMIAALDPRELPKSARTGKHAQDPTAD